jgi:hypothetical protein
MEKMYEEGGLATDGMNVDPVSGNDIPVGSNATDVRDDVDAKLSTGEYVVPADVVKYVGVAQLEKLVDKAKAGLEKMDDDGRIGGEPTTDVEEVTLGGDLSVLDGYATGGMVAGTDIDGIINRVKAAAMKDPSIINMLKAKGIFVQEPQPQGQLQQQAMSQGAVPTQAAPPSMQGKAEPAAFAEGGLTGPSITPFNPYAYTPGFSAETGAMEVTPPLSGTTVAPTVGATAAAPVTGICDPGFVWDASRNMCVPIESSQGSSSGVVTPEATSNPNAWMDKFDYSRPENLLESTMTTLGSGEKEKDVGLLGGLGGMVTDSLSRGLVGGLVGKTMATNTVAQAAANAIILRDAGRDDLADKLQKQIKEYSKEKGLKNVPTAWRNGDRLATTIMENRNESISKWGTTTTKPTTTTTAATPAPVANLSGNVAESNTPIKLSPNQISDKYRAQGTNAGDKIASVAEKAAKTGGSIASVSQTGSKGYGSSSSSDKSTGGQGNQGSGSGWGGMAKGGLVSKPKPKAKLTPNNNNTTNKKGLGANKP